MFTLTLPLACVVSLVSLYMATISAATTGLGWVTLHSADTCDGTMYTFVRVTAIYSAVLTGVYGTGFLMGLLSLAGELCATVSLWTNCVILVALGIIGSFTNIGIMGWGIAALTSNNPCKDTMYYVDAMVVIGVSGLLLVMSLSGTATGLRVRLSTNLH